MKNNASAYDILSYCKNAGVRTLCVCPGGRNAPLVEALQWFDDMEVLTFFDERAASFFALGRARRDRSPVAVIVTSGTAVSEMLSATVEAYYTQTPLLLITADRPKAYRGTGAPQTIEQSDVFGMYVESKVDMEAGEPLELRWPQNFSAHINICFDEPLLGEAGWKPVGGPKSFLCGGPSVDSNEPPQRLSQWTEKFHRPLVVVGGLSAEAQKICEQKFSGWGCPFYLEGTSGLRESPLLLGKTLLLEKQIQAHLASGVFDSVLRIGDVPTARFWRDLNGMEDIPVVSLSSNPFSGGLRGQHIRVTPHGWSDALDKAFAWDCQALLETHRQLETRFEALISQYPLSEAAWIRRLSQALPSQSDLYIGNSLPIREWDLAASRDRKFWVRGNRGANGIDGQLASAIGLSRKEMPMACILGDLTTLYDASSLALRESLQKQNVDFTLFIMNNNGGQIFSSLFQNPLFVNPQSVDFVQLASSFYWKSLRVNQSTAPLKFSGRTVVEVVPDSKETEAFRKAFEDLCAT